MNSFEKDHRGGTNDAAAQLAAMTPPQRAMLGVRHVPKKHLYKRFHYKESVISRALAETFECVDGEGVVTVCDMAWFTQQIIAASIEDGYPSSRSRAVDGTDWQTSAKLHYPRKDSTPAETDSLTYDGAPLPTADDDDATAAVEAGEATTARSATQVAPSKNKAASKKKATDGGGQPKILILGHDENGRRVYTKDVDARAGWRSATNNRKAGTFIGYETHLVVQARDVAWTDYSSSINLGPAVPGFITSAVVVPAGSHKSRSIVPALLAEKKINNIVWDRGYTHEDRATWAIPLRQAGISITFDLTKRQRGVGEAVMNGIVIDGNLFSEHLPAEFRAELPRPPRNCPTKDLPTYTAPFDARAKWRFSVHGRPDDDGYFRMRCPFCAGRLGILGRPNRKLNAGAPRVELPDGARCCAGVRRFTAADLLHAQEIPYGTTAYWVSYHRRNIVENANARMKGQYISLDRLYTRKFGVTKQAWALAFAIVGVNRDIARAWREDSARDLDTQTQPATRARRRTSTYRDVLPTGDTTRTAARAAEPPGTDPPERRHAR